ncbi:MAG: hypothetical protein Alpg2KO_08630 [Alphaproteobacteria bacterium]
MNTDISDRIELASAEQVARMHKRLGEKLSAKADRALGQLGLDDAALKQAMMTYLRTARQARQEPGVGQLARIAKGGIAALESAQASLPVHFSLSEIRKLRDHNPDWSELQDTRIFKGRDRVYLRLQAPQNTQKGETELAVTELLTALGYDQIDYKAGRCTDERGNSPKIGRILSREAPDLLESFAKDPVRAAAKAEERQMIVLSRHPYDIARMSTGRGWESCMSKSGFNYRYVAEDIRQGAMIAYLISADDPNIDDPQARILIKPHEGEDGSRLMRGGPVYGLRVPGFSETLGRLLEERINGHRVLRCTLPDGLYADGGAARDVLHIPPGAPATQVLQALNIPYETDGETITVNGNLNLSGKGLTELPDLSNVVVNGFFDISYNRLHDLTGAPKQVNGDFRAEYCLLNELTGAPAHIGGDFIISRSRIDDFAGGPRHVGGDVIANECWAYTLDGFPAEIGGSISLQQNSLKSLSGLPRIIKGDLDVSYNQLRSLSSPVQRITGSLTARHSGEYASLRGMPLIIDGEFLLDGHHQLEDLDGMGHVGSYVETPLGGWDNSADIPKDLLPTRIRPRVKALGQN